MIYPGVSLRYRGGMNLRWIQAEEWKVVGDRTFLLLVLEVNYYDFTQCLVFFHLRGRIRKSVSVEAINAVARTAKILIGCRGKYLEVTR